jgi:hypothetical protein
MDRLSHTPATLREIVEADLRRAARLIIRIQDEIDWQWRLAPPEGDYHLSVTMPEDVRERTMVLRRIETLMHWKSCQGFSVAVETSEPDAVYCVGVTPAEAAHCMARITRQPKPWTAANFGAVEWLPVTSVDPTLVALLPRARRPMTPKEINALQKWFGVDGKFPALHVDTLQIRGV